VFEPWSGSHINQDVVRASAFSAAQLCPKMCSRISQAMGVSYGSLLWS
jgi:hypothetical protein